MTSSLLERAAKAAGKLAVSEVASLGGKAAHAQGVAPTFTSEEARVAGRKGGLARAENARSKAPSEKRKRVYKKEYGTTPRARFSQQRNGARNRGIAWDFTFEEWWAVWEASGKWEQRGVRRGCYVMARHGDTGPYSRSNVSIIRHEDNIRQALSAPDREPISSFLHLRSYKVGHGKGWRYHPKKNKTRPYEARFRSKHLGSFATKEEAEAAYKRCVAEHISSSVERA
jgi:hypothetical protein